MKRYEEINSTLLYLFDKWMIEDPRRMEHMPANAVVILQVEGYKSFNEWAKKISLAHPLEKGQKVVYAIFTFKPKMTPRQVTSQKLVRAHVEELELQPA